MKSTEERLEDAKRDLASFMLELGERHKLDTMERCQLAAHWLLTRLVAEGEPLQGVPVVGCWDAPSPSTPLDELRKVAERIKGQTGYQRPPPPVLYVSSDRYARLLEQGYIHADGTLTPLGNESIMAASVEALSDVERMEMP